MARTEDTTLLRDPRFLSIALASAVGVFGNQAVPPVLPSIGADLALTDSQIGLVMTSFFGAVLVAVPVLGVVADVYGRRPVVLGSLLLFGGGGVAVLAAESFAALLALRAVQGVGISGMTALSVALLGDFFTGERGTTAQGIRASGNGIAIIAAPALAGLLAGFGWRYAFLLYGAAFPAFVLVYYYLPEGTDDSDDGASFRTQLRAYTGSMADSLNDRNLAVLLLGGFTLFFVRYGMLTVVPLLATRQLGAGPAVLGLVLSVIGVVRVVVSPLSGRLVGLVSRKRAFVATMGTVAGSMALLAVVPDVRSLTGALIVFSVGMALFNPVLNDTITATAGEDTRAGVVSAMQTAKGVANTTAPTLFTLVLALTDFLAVFALAALVAAGYVVVVVAGLDPAAY